MFLNKEIAASTKSPNLKYWDSIVITYKLPSIHCLTKCLWLKHIVCFLYILNKVVAVYFYININDVTYEKGPQSLIPKYLNLLVNSKSRSSTWWFCSDTGIMWTIMLSEKFHTAVYCVQLSYSNYGCRIAQINLGQAFVTIFWAGLPTGVTHIESFGVLCLGMVWIPKWEYTHKPTRLIKMFTQHVKMYYYLVFNKC